MLLLLLLQELLNSVATATTLLQCQKPSKEREREKKIVEEEGEEVSQFVRKSLGFLWLPVNGTKYSLSPKLFFDAKML